MPRAEALLFMASRAQLVQREIRPALARGDVVLLDRFFLSTYAYQIAGHGLPEDEVRSANRFATGGLVPDVTILLSFPVVQGLARAARRTASHDRMEAMGESPFTSVWLVRSRPSPSRRGKPRIPSAGRSWPWMPRVRRMKSRRESCRC